MTGSLSAFVASFLMMLVFISTASAQEASVLPSAEIVEEATASNADRGVEISSENRRFSPRLINNVRLRYEGVDDDKAPVNAQALTIRYRGTLETHLTNKTTFLAEVEAVGILVDDFNNGTENWTGPPVIPDPGGVELNRLQILTEFKPDTRLTIGRQRLAFDDERFVGTLAFRQNDQTFDAVRASTRLGSDILLDTAYIRRTNRILGNDSDFGVFDGNSFLGNVNVPSPLGRVAVFHYALDLETGPEEARSNRFSSSTTGVRVIGRRQFSPIGLLWEASYARQRDSADNPTDYAANYWLGAVTADLDDLSVNVRTEIFSSDNGVEAFQTPLGTLHKFQGDADLFLQTPIDGLVDVSTSAEWRIGKVGPLRAVKAFARYHWFTGEESGVPFGEEINFSLAMKYHRSTFSVAYAAYEAQNFAVDTQKIFITFIHPF